MDIVYYYLSKATFDVNVPHHKSGVKGWRTIFVGFSIPEELPAQNGFNSIPGGTWLRLDTCLDRRRALW
jgi:hypothetical protein